MRGLLRLNIGTGNCWFLAELLLDRLERGHQGRCNHIVNISNRPAQIMSMSPLIVSSLICIRPGTRSARKA